MANEGRQPLLMVSDGRLASFVDNAQLGRKKEEGKVRKKKKKKKINYLKLFTSVSTVSRGIISIYVSDFKLNLIVWTQLVNYQKIIII